MPTPSGTIGLSDVNIELGKSSTSNITMNDSDVRLLAGVPSGTISMDNLRNKSSASISISPALNGQTTISLASPLSISSFGEYTIQSLSGDLTVDIKMWGAGAASGRQYDTTSFVSIGPGGGGGATTGRIILRSGSSYILRIGQKGGQVSGSSGGTTYLAGGAGGAPVNVQGAGYSAIFKTSVSQANALLMAGGGGGGGDSRFAGGVGGAGGGTNAQGSGDPGAQGGGAGTQSAGGAAAIYNGATAGSALTGGNCGNAGGATVSSAGGGGGYFGGGGGNVAGGGGGSGRVNSSHPDVVSGTTYTGSGSTAALNSDSDRGGAGQGMIGAFNAPTTTNTDGKILITKV